MCIATIYPILQQCRTLMYRQFIKKDKAGLILYFINIINKTCNVFDVKLLKMGHE